MWKSAVTHQIIEQIKSILYLKFFKIASFDNSFANSWYSLNLLHKDAFITFLKEFPNKLSTCCLLFLLNWVYETGDSDVLILSSRNNS